MKLNNDFALVASGVGGSAELAVWSTLSALPMISSTKY